MLSERQTRRIIGQSLRTRHFGEVAMKVLLWAVGSTLQSEDWSCIKYDGWSAISIRQTLGWAVGPYTLTYLQRWHYQGLDRKDTQRETTVRRVLLFQPVPFIQ
jgi:hypothetical protein